MNQILYNQRLAEGIRPLLKDMRQFNEIDVSCTGVYAPLQPSAFGKFKFFKSLGMYKIYLKKLSGLIILTRKFRCIRTVQRDGSNIFKRGRKITLETYSSYRVRQQSIGFVLQKYPCVYK